MAVKIEVVHELDGEENYDKVQFNTTKDYLRKVIIDFSKRNIILGVGDIICDEYAYIISSRQFIEGGHIVFYVTDK